MQLVTRLMLRLVVVGIMMLIAALGITLFAAQKDIGREASVNQKIGQLITTLGELENDSQLALQIKKIDELNRSDALRHLHVALFDTNGQRLTQPDEDAEPGPFPWLNQLLASDVASENYSLSVLRPDGERIRIELEPNPGSESAEVLRNVWLFIKLYAALAAALIAAMWISVKLAFAPLTDILAALARFEAGDFGTRLAHSATRELNLIAQALNHLAGVLTEQMAKQRELLHRLQDVQEEERRKLAHELHDEFGQLLTAMQVDASYLLKKSAGQPELEACAQDMVDNSGAILMQVKSLLVQLRPYGLKGGEERDIALEQALHDLVRQRQARGDNELDCHLSVKLAQAAIPQRLAVAIYRITQEALTNVMRHAQASAVEISVQFDQASQRLTLRIADNGIGLDPQRSLAGGRDKNGLGQVGMRERVLANHGSLRFVANVPSGLLIEAVFPLAGAIGSDQMNAHAT